VNPRANYSKVGYNFRALGSKLRGRARRFQLNLLIASLSCLLLLIACKPSPKVLWQFQTQAPVYASPVIADDLLIVPSNDSYIYALELNSGKVVWKRNLGAVLWASPFVEKDLIYEGTGDGYLFCLEARTGKVRWRFKTKSMIEFTPCTDESGVYFGSNDGHIYKVDKTGKQLWTHDTSGYRNWGTCVFYKDLVIADSWDSNLYGLNRNTGETVWKVSSGKYNYGSPELSGDQVYFATHDAFFNIDAASGNVLWKRKTTYLDHVLVRDGFLWTNEKGLMKRSMDGDPIAHIDFPTFTTYKPVPVKDYFILTGRGILYAVSKNLEILWKFKADEAFWSPGVERNNIFYNGNRNGSVYALILPK